MYIICATSPVTVSGETLATPQTYSSPMLLSVYWAFGGRAAYSNGVCGRTDTKMEHPLQGDLYVPLMVINPGIACSRTGVRCKNTLIRFYKNTHKHPSIVPFLTETVRQEGATDLLSRSAPSGAKLLAYLVSRGASGQMT
jgi:hypothetical protein